MFEFLFILSLVCPVVIIAVKYFTFKARLRRRTRRVLNWVANHDKTFTA